MNRDPYGLMARDPLSLPEFDPYQERAQSAAAKPDGRKARIDAQALDPLDEALNPYLSTPDDPFGAALSGNPPGETLFGRDAALDSLRSFRTRHDAASRRAGAAAGWSQPTTGAKALGADGFPASLAGSGLDSDPTAEGLRAPETGGFGGMAPESGDLISPQPAVASGTAAKPAAGPLKSGASELLGFNPYNANSIVAPSQPASLGASGATAPPYDASGSAPSGSLSSRLGGNANSAGPLGASLSSSLASPLSPAPLGPRH